MHGHMNVIYIYIYSTDMYSHVSAMCIKGVSKMLGQTS